MASDLSTEPAGPSKSHLVVRLAESVAERGRGVLIVTGQNSAADMLVQGECFTVYCRKLENGIGLIHGPGGTGKTVVVAELAESVAEQHRKCLIVPYSLPHNTTLLQLLCLHLIFVSTLFILSTTSTTLHHFLENIVAEQNRHCLVITSQNSAADSDIEKLMNSEYMVVRVHHSAWSE